MMQRGPRRLRAFLHHLVLASASFAFVAVAAAGLAMLVPWAIELDSGSSSPQRALAATGKILAFNETFWISAAVSVVAACVAAAWLARHITGPLSRFVGAFREIASGGVPAPLVIRTTDYLGEELAAFNAMAEQLAARALERDRTQAELLGELEQIESLGHALGAPDVGAAAARASDLAKRLVPSVQRAGGR